VGLVASRGSTTVFPTGVSRSSKRKSPNYIFSPCLPLSLSGPGTMDSFHYRDTTGNSKYGHFLPHFPSSRPETSFQRSYPSTPQPSYSPPSLLRSPPSLSPTRNITPPKDIVSLNEKQHAVVKDSKLPYNQVREYVDCFKAWRSGVGAKRGSLEVYERNLSIKMSLKEWNRLSKDLNIFETDQKSEPFYRITQDILLN
jgi:hypothetical protein